jgi:O-antigen/teichoic acid export membrane protein
VGAVGLEDRTGEPPKARRGILANTLFGVAAQATSAISTTVLTLYLVRQLGPSDFGVFSLALSIGAIVLMFADFGLGASVARYVAENAGEAGRLRHVTNTGLRLKILAGFGVSAAMFLAAPIIADLYHNHGLSWPVRVSAIAVFFESMLMLYTSTFAALQRVSLNARAIVVESLVEGVATIGIVALGGGVTGAVAGRAAGYTVGALVAAVLLARLVGRPRVRPVQRDRTLGRTIFAYARPLLIINGAYTIFAYIDALLIGGLLSTRDVGEFTAPLRLVVLFGYIGQSVGVAVSPRLAGTDRDVPTFIAALRALVILQVALAAVLVAWAEPIVNTLLGPNYRVAGQVLRGLAPYAFFIGVGPLITMTVTFFGAARQRVPIVLGCLAVNLVIDLVLLPTVGVIGATIGTGVATAIYVPAHLRICVQELELDLRPLGMSLLRALIAGGAASGALLVIGSSRLSVVDWIAGAAVVPLMFGGVLLVLGELRPSEWRAVVERLGRSRSSAAPAGR